jgi:hypothetical protein
MPERDICEVKSYNGIGRAARELFRNGGPPVSAMRSEPLLAEFFFHEACPEIADAKRRAGFRRFVRETVARQIRHHDIECVFGTPAERLRIGKHRTSCFR